MSGNLGSFCLVLHGHLPYVLKHGVWPHGEDWLYEAAAETYMPLLDMVGHCLLYEVEPHITVGLTPVLLEQLSHEHFKKGFERYLADRIERAKKDRKDFEGFEHGHMIYLAERWVELFTHLQQRFAEIDRDIPKAFAKHAMDGHIQIITSAATHGYLPLLYEDASVRAQIRAGMHSSERILGFRPRGMWLPECAYRPSGAWNPPVGWGGKDYRIGIEHLAADEGIDHFFVEHHLIEGARSEYVHDDGQWHKVGWDEAEKYAGRGWRSVHEPHRVNSDGTSAGRCVAVARDPRVCESVWSGAIGYPADGVYLEFHKKWGAKRGLRYWKITGNKVDLGDKHLYYPENIEGKLHEHAQHFCNHVKDRLRHHAHITGGRKGVVTAAFDAELFGHWWFEGIDFLRQVILQFGADDDVQVSTVENVLDTQWPDKSVSLPEGSWGDGGHHDVWANDKVNWMWDIAYRCEANFGRATCELPWESNPQIEKLLKDAGRELLLLQASDWAFVITRGQAIDYGIKRFMLHVSRFETLLDLAEKLSEDSAYLGKLDETEQFEVKDAELHDVIFPEIHLDWWRM